MQDSYEWDALGRMTSLRAAGATSLYAYRADGMRVRKERYIGAAGSRLVLSRYDGQMPVETAEIDESGDGTQAVTAVERHGRGVQGLVLIERTTHSGTTTSFPL